ncbi:MULTISPECIES: sensor histidine kinase [Haloarcula]|uniref:sensor histidine kinase n=1 Tax=Haloarcula TaxID=2237 RepID=UPI0023EBDC58|nr:ATP-binding protein [Halomicroarcula sp. XH51]
MNRTGESLRVAVVGETTTHSESIELDLDTETVEVVESTEPATAAADRDVDAVVVTDALPAHDGLAALEEAREADPSRPVFVATESTDPARVEALLSAGAADVTVLGSPGSMAQLIARIRARTATPTGDGHGVAHRFSDVASNLAHDAKNPLNVVVGRLELMEMDPVHADAITRSVDRIDSLLEELSTLGSVSRPVTETERVDVGDVAETVWQTLDVDDATLETDDDVTVVADPERLQTFLERLFENALEHGSEDVTVTVAATDSGFAVADDGPGIPADDRDHVFEQGYATTNGGEGYGLFVAATIADAHGWTLEVGESEAGGTRVSVATGRRATPR